MNEKPTCPVCRGDAELAVLPEASGRHGNVRVRVTDLPVLSCTYCQRQAPRYYDFVQDAARILTHVCDLPAAREVGIFFKQPGCCSCRATLQDAEIEPYGVPGAELELADPAFLVDLSVRATLCPKCGTRQFVAAESLEEQIAAALRTAFLGVPAESRF